MIRVIEEKTEKKKLYKYKTIKLKIPKGWYLDEKWGHTDPIPNVESDKYKGEMTFVLKKEL